ncbi:MAG: ABC transporter substrate-binding protein [Caldisphaera sp.]
MKTSGLIVALIIIVIVGFGALGYSIISLNNDIQKEIANLNSTLLSTNNKIETSFNKNLSNLAIVLGSLESGIKNFNNSINNQIVYLKQEINSLSKQNEFPVSLIDATNTTVIISQYPTRIISLDPSTTDLLLAINATNQIVGVDNASLYYLPPQYENQLLSLYKEGKIINIGDTYYGLDIEKIMSLNPDLIIATYGYGSSASTSVFKEYGIPVLLLPSFNSLDGLYNSIIMVGMATGNTKEAAALVENMSESIAYLSSLTINQTHYNIALIGWIDPTYVTGNNTFQNNMIILSGNKNAFSNISWWGVISPEEILEANPSIIIMPTNYFNESDLISWLNSTIGNAYKNISAIRYGRVYVIRGYYIDYIDEPGPMTVEGLELLIALTHPNVLNITSIPPIITPSDFPLPKLTVFSS